MQPMKRCSKCKIEYPATPEYFHRQTRMKDGLRACCRACRMQESKDRAKIKPNPDWDGTMKQCTKCGVEYPATMEYFFADPAKSDGLYPSCKACRAIYRTENRDAINEYKREHRKKNGDKMRQMGRDYYLKNKASIRLKAKEKRLSNIDEFLRKEQEYRDKNQDRINQKTRERRSKNKDEVNRANKEYRDKHPEKFWLSRQRYYRENRERVLARTRQYAINNRPIVKAIQHRYEARKLGLPDTFTGEQVNYALQYFNRCCAYCGTELKEIVHFDHLIPVSNPNCPGTIASNMIPACASCNTSKRSSEAFTWLKRRFGEEHAAYTLAVLETYFASVKE